MSNGLRLAAVIFGLLIIGGCQTSYDGVDVAPTLLPSVESNFIETNDPNRLGRVHLAAGNNAMAERHFKDAVEKNKEDADSWIGLAAAYDNLGRFELADRAYAQALRLRGETVEIVNNRGYSYLLRGDGPRALAQFERALALDPDNPVILNNVRLLRLGQRQVRGTPL